MKVAKLEAKGRADKSVTIAQDGLEMKRKYLEIADGGALVMRDVARHLGKMAATQEKRQQAAEKEARITTLKKANEALDGKVFEAQLQLLRTQYLMLLLTPDIPASASPSAAAALDAA